MEIYSFVKALIERRFYQTGSEAHNKIDVFYAKERLTDDQFKELSFAIMDNYPEMLPQEPPIEIGPIEEPDSRPVEV